MYSVEQNSSSRGRKKLLTYKIDEDISLRTFREDDAEEFFHLTISSKAYLKDWLGWLDNIKTVEDSTRTIQRRLNKLVENGGYTTSFAIIYKGKIAGTIGFNELDKTNRIGGIGYWLGQNYQDKGIMTKAFKRMIDYGFKELRLNRIEVSVAVNNDKSRALPERFGFTKEGVIRQAEWLYEHYVDHVLYSLLSIEWEC